MRIGFIVTRFPSISQTFILNQITGLLDRGHDVTIYAQADQAEPRARHQASIQMCGRCAPRPTSKQGD